MKNKKKQLKKKVKHYQKKNELIPPLSPTKLFFLLLKLLDWMVRQKFLSENSAKFLIKTETN